MPKSSTRAAVPVSYAQRAHNGVAAALSPKRGQKAVSKPRPRARPREQGRKTPSKNSIRGPFHRAVSQQLDRMLNPRVHYGETQPRAGSVGGILSSMTKTIHNATTADAFFVAAQCCQLNQGIITASSATATTDFANAAVVTGSSTYSTSQMSRWSWASSMLTASIGTAALSAGGFVTIGSMPGMFSAGTSTFNTLDPGDLLNMPGAVTMPLWDFVNKPWTGFMRKISPDADYFSDTASASGQYDQILVPFILFQLPSALISSFTVMIVSYNTYDFIPDVTDSGIPALTPPHTALEVAAYDVAKTCVGRIASGFIEALVSSASSGRIGSDFLNSYEQLTGDYGFSQRIGRLGITYV